MLVFDFGFTGLSIKRGVLHGEYFDYPLTTIRLLVVTVIIPARTSTRLIRDALSGLARDKDWIIKNSKAVRIAKKKAYAKTKKEALNSLQKELDWAEKQYFDMKEKCNQAQNENLTLRRAIKIIND